MKTITDGSAVFAVRDKRMQAMIDIFYPVGSVYISADKNKTKADFPFMAYGTWEEVPANLCLQTGNASEAGNQRRAGLPNIKGNATTQWFSNPNDLSGGYQNNKDYWQGAINIHTWGTRCVNIINARGDGYDALIYFDASKYNSIYGLSNTVQPPAYMVRAWVRTA